MGTAFHLQQISHAHNVQVTLAPQGCPPGSYTCFTYTRFTPKLTKVTRTAQVTLAPKGCPQGSYTFFTPKLTHTHTAQVTLVP